MPQTFIPPHGGYKNLLSYQKSRIVYRATVRCCERFIRKGDRTYDQKVQTARSGKQNIVEGSLSVGDILERVFVRDGGVRAARGFRQGDRDASEPRDAVNQQGGDTHPSL